MKYDGVRDFLWQRFERGFWDKVEEDGDGCLIWQGSIYNRPGYRYGKVELLETWDKTARRRGLVRFQAHRVAYELVFGPVPAGMVLLHVCDKPQCVHPGHLVPGTQADNLGDRHDKGRYAGYVPAETVRLIREQAARGVSLRSITRAVGHNRSTVTKVVNQLSPYR